ncbi:glycosyltransferase [Ulvibacterium sp.]|uniref:glycosyltransferase n=1 Tax=Ulvibacterium sp. TaxID=2665914 RepID=UPI00261033B6|nr:glycosyltransferase [Ulvibacterium sp.]
MNLFIIQPFQSHLYPVFGLAHKFESQGKKVVFTTTPQLIGILKNEGFEYWEFAYLSEYIIKNYKSFLGLLLKSSVSKAFYRERKKEFGNAFRHTQKLIEELKPTHVFIDQSLAEYYFFFRPFVSNITIVHTKVYSGKTKGIPPMNSTVIPETSLFSKIKIELLWIRELWKQRFRELVLKTAFLGKDETYFWKEHCRKYGMQWNRQVDLNHSLNRGVKNVDHLLLLPRELEFPRFKKPKHVRFFEKLSQKNESVYYTPTYSDLKRKYLLGNSLKVIYMAFGTLAQGAKVTNFFNTVISVVGEFSETVLIISKGNHKMELKKANNAFSFDYLPQQDVLSHADLFITHGGLGSVKEAFHNNVPMLVVPMNKFIDQNGNAARVKANGLGDYINIDKYSRSEVMKKIKMLLPDLKVQIAI